MWAPCGRDEWTAGDQLQFNRRVLPHIVRTKWWGFEELATFIFTWFCNVLGNRRDWTASYARRYTRSLGF